MKSYYSILTGERTCTVYTLSTLEIKNSQIVETVVGQLTAKTWDDLMTRFAQRAETILGGKPLLKREGGLFPYYCDEATGKCLQMS